MKKCSIEGCNNLHEAHGYCAKHYQRYRKYGDPLHMEKERHGMESSKEYKSWHNMKLRCYNVKDINYKHYGGRGIKVCDKWLNSFTAFYKDMGDKPFSKAQIDRIDNNGDYEPSNCRWVSCAENNRNQSTTKLNKEKVIAIRQLYNEGVYRQFELAKLYNVSIQAINDVVHFRRWVFNES